MPTQLQQCSRCNWGRRITAEGDIIRDYNPAEMDGELRYVALRRSRPVDGVYPTVGPRVNPK